MILIWIVKSFLIMFNLVFIMKKIDPDLKGVIFQYEFYHQFFVLQIINKIFRLMNIKDSLRLLIFIYYPICFFIFIIVILNSKLVYIRYYVFIILLEILTETVSNILILNNYNLKYKWINESVCLLIKSIYLFSSYHITIETYITISFIYYLLLFANYIIIYLKECSIVLNFNLYITIKDLSSFIHFIFLSYLGIFINNIEEYILFYFYSSNEQGIFKLSMNLGGSVPRFILYPIEEYLSIEFSKSQNIELFRKYFYNLIIFSLFFICYGLFHTKNLVLFIYGGKWKDLDILLSWFCVYILFLSINGISESFIYSNINYVHLKFNILFILLSNGLYFMSIYIVIIKLSSPVQYLILCKMFYLFLRIIYSFYFIFSYHQFIFKIPINLILSFLFIFIFNLFFNSICFNLIYFCFHFLFIYKYK